MPVSTAILFGSLSCVVDCLWALDWRLYCFIRKPAFIGRQR
jgi:hypothetical protein